MDEIRLDKTVFEVVKGFDNTSDKEFWWSKTPEERLISLEYLRRLIHGDNYSEQGFQRILEVVK